VHFVPETLLGGSVMNRSHRDSFSKLVVSVSAAQLAVLKKNKRFRVTFQEWEDAGETLLHLKGIEAKYPELDWEHIYSQSLSK
jgi:hypothetical protein